MINFQTETEKFLLGLDYFGDLDPATVYSIRKAAEELDADYRVTLATEYRRQKEAIQGMAPIKNEVKPDPLLVPVPGLVTRAS